MFTQTTWDENGHPIRDPDSTTYVAAIETAEDFGKRLYVEAWNRDWNHAVKKVVLGDGADQIVDIFHARQHLWDLARRLHPNDEAGQKRWMQIHQDLLDRGKLKKLTVALRSIRQCQTDREAWH